MNDHIIKIIVKFTENYYIFISYLLREKSFFFFDELINCQICEPTDHSTGFGGKFGVQKDRVDKSAVGWEHHEKVEKHESQKGFCSSFFFNLLIENE